MIIVLLVGIFVVLFLELLEEVDEPFNFIHKHTSFNALHGDSLLKNDLIPFSDDSN